MLTVASPAAGATTYQVDKTTDAFGGGCTAAPNDCSVRDAIANANSTPGNTVMIPAGTYTLSLPGNDDADASGDLDPIESMNIVGAGAGTTTITANGIDRVLDFQANPSGVWTLSGLTVTGGRNVADGGGIRQKAGTLSIGDAVIADNKIAVGSSGGGGIYVQTGTLNITRTTFAGNTVTGGEGGGIYTSAPVSLNIDRSAITGNATFTVTDGGGGIYNQDSLTMVNSTLAGNTTDDTGGGLDNHGPAVLTNVTIAGNGAGANGGGINRDSGSVQLRNTIVAGNTAPAGANCSGAILSNGHNLDSGSTCGLGATGDLINVNPMLGPLANNGGPTQTEALRVGSPAVNAADAATCPGTDQRDVARPQRGGCDMGAYEVAAPPALSGLKIRPRKFATSARSSAASARKRSGGATVSYSLSTAATVTFTVERRVKGHKRGKRTLPGSITVTGKQGPNSFRFSGRLGKKKLPPGRYKLVAIPTDALTGDGASMRAPFRILG
jgi:predicted outer membrane repeat protein